MSVTYDVELTVRMSIEVTDPTVITRCTENHDDEGNPSADGNGWRDSHYPLRTRDAVLEHLAFNRLANGVYDISTLDGWADVASGENFIHGPEVDLLDATVAAEDPGDVDALTMGPAGE